MMKNPIFDLENVGPTHTQVNAVAVTEEFLFYVHWKNGSKHSLCMLAGPNLVSIIQTPMTKPLLKYVWNKLEDFLFPIAQYFFYWNLLKVNATSECFFSHKKCKHQILSIPFQTTHPKE